MPGLQCLRTVHACESGVILRSFVFHIFPCFHWFVCSCFWRICRGCQHKLKIYQKISWGSSIKISTVKPYEVLLDIPWFSVYQNHFTSRIEPCSVAKCLARPCWTPHRPGCIAMRNNASETQYSLSLKGQKVAYYSRMLQHLEHDMRLSRELLSYWQWPWQRLLRLAICEAQTILWPARARLRFFVFGGPCGAGWVHGLHSHTESQRNSGF